MAKKYYAVRVGRDGSGIYETWEECKKQVYGIGRAVYKSFPTLQEAQAYLKDGEAQGPQAVPFGGGEYAIAYVDGSFDKRTGDYACGAVLFWKGEQKEFSQRFTDPEMAEMHNVAGEIMGVLTVLDYCREQGIPAIEIHYDYEGVARWADGSWKTNRPGTRRYAQACREAGAWVKTRFVYVKGHSGDKYNDMADALAKRALGL